MKSLNILRHSTINHFLLKFLSSGYQSTFMFSEESDYKTIFLFIFKGCIIHFSKKITNMCGPISKKNFAKLNQSFVVTILWNASALIEWGMLDTVHCTVEHSFIINDYRAQISVNMNSKYFLHSFNIHWIFQKCKYRRNWEEKILFLRRTLLNIEYHFRKSCHWWQH